MVRHAVLTRQCRSMQLKAVHQFPVLVLGSGAGDFQGRAPAALLEVFAGCRASEPHNLGPEKTGARCQLDAAGLFKQAIGVEHELLREPLQLAALLQVERQGLP